MRAGFSTTSQPKHPAPHQRARERAEANLTGEGRAQSMHMGPPHVAVVAQQTRLKDSGTMALALVASTPFLFPFAFFFVFFGQGRVGIWVAQLSRGVGNPPGPGGKWAPWVLCTNSPSPSHSPTRSHSIEPSLLLIPAHIHLHKHALKKRTYTHVIHVAGGPLA